MKQNDLLPVKSMQILLLSFLLVLLPLTVSAITAEVVGNVKKTTVDGIEWTYTVLNEEEMTCEVGGVELDEHGEETGIAAISESTTGNVTIPSLLDGYSVVGICNSAFREIPISEVVIPAGVKGIGEKAFMQCENLTSVTLPEGVTFIGEEAFSESAISNITLPQSLVRIGEQAFEHTLITTITLPKNVKYLGNEDRVSDSGLLIEEDDLYGDVFNGCELLTAVIVAEGNTAYASVDGMLLTKDKKTLLFCPIACQATAVPQGVEHIYEEAFYKSHLTTITLPASLTEIGRRAFYGCDNLNVVVSYIEEPFEISGGTFGYETSATLYVPAGCKPKYEATSGWDLFTNIVEMSSPSGIAIDETNFPDENFRNWVLAQDYGQDGVLTEAEIAGVTEIDVSRKNISSLRGIEYFTELTKLYCNGNQLTSLDMSENTLLKNLICDYNSLTSLNVTKCTALVNLDCESNQLTTLDITKNTALTDLACGENLLISLDVSMNINLKDFDCSNNQLTSLNVSNNKVLSDFVCYKNKINGAAMDALIESLPRVNSDFVPISPFDSDEQNVITKTQVAAAQLKGWKTWYIDENGKWQKYEGSEPEMEPIDNGETIDLGTEIDENTNLEGTVVDNVFVNISNGDGGFDPVEKCIIVSKPTDDSAINGKDIFGDDFKDNYTGIVFKVNEGKGSIKVVAETQGNMVLKVKIGNSDPIEMELDGKLKVKFPYDVSEETLVYIYGGLSSAGAKATGARLAPSATDLLKIYGFEIVSYPSGIDAIENGQQPDAPVYNLNGQRVNIPGKGIYIKNGRKVLVK